MKKVTIHFSILLYFVTFGAAYTFVEHYTNMKKQDQYQYETGGKLEIQLYLDLSNVTFKIEIFIDEVTCNVSV